ncbi:MAG: phosphoglycerate mutase [Candidatus Hydrogenedentota bacterium]
MGELILVRHGQASFHDENYDKLSPLGEDQARLLGRYWARIGFIPNHLFSGPLARQRRSAELIAEGFREAGLHVPDLRIVDDLAEMPVEEIGKRFLPQLCMQDPEMMETMMQFSNAEDRMEKERLFQRVFEKVVAMWGDGAFAEADVETWETFVGRIGRAIDHVLSHNGGGERLVVVTSGGPTGVTVQRALGLDAPTTMNLMWRIRNASITEFLFTEGRMTMSSFNAVPHLEDPDFWTYR